MTLSAGRWALRRSSMADDAAIVKRSFRPDLVKVAVPGIGGIALSAMACAALPQLRNASRVHRVMASGASGSRFGLIDRTGVWTDSRFMGLVIEQHDPSTAADVEPDEFRWSLLALVRHR